MKFDNILPFVGEFGRYQLTQYFLAGLSCLPLSLHVLVNVFAAAVPPHLCHVPELGTHNLTWDQRQKLTSPLFNSGDLDPSCWVYDVDYSVLNITAALDNQTGLDTSNISSCSKWQYDTTYTSHTMVVQVGPTHYHMIHSNVTKSLIAILELMLIVQKYFVWVYS